MNNLRAMMECLWSLDDVMQAAWVQLDVNWSGKATHYIHWRANYAS
jgi:hypothetical protein